VPTGWSIRFHSLLAASLLLAAALLIAPVAPANASHTSCKHHEYGSGAGETLTGTRHRDLIKGAGGGDVLKGLYGSDCLYGGNRADKVKGGAGRDHLRGGRGHDRLVARDGRRDVVNCGKGDDIARVDQNDRIVGCEQTLPKLSASQGSQSRTGGSGATGGGTTSNCEVTVAGVPLAVPVPACAVVARDTAQDSDPRPFWGSIDCKSSSRYTYSASGGDPHAAAGGAPQGDSAYRRLTVLDGDDYYGERCELGKNDHRTGPTAFYREGQHRLTYLSYKLGDDYPLSNPGWQVVMQMKQTQPSANGGGTPVISLEARNGRWNLIQSNSAGYSSDTHVLWSTPAETGVWTRFAFDVVYSQDPAIGSIRVSVDLNGDSDSLDPGEQSPTFKTYTLKRETTDSDYLHAGDSIPSHLRVGVYHNSAISCPSMGTCSAGVDNVEVVRAG
jgi:Polysaccharide lyase/RTX calcium-binding nonapeptide repeat (4 copies)